MGMLHIFVLLCRRFSVVILLICLCAGMATTERTCGSDFDDVGSSALLAPIVLEGRARRVLYETREHLPGNVSRPSAGASVVFDRLRFYKGQLTESSVGVRAIEVGHFNEAADREACVAPVPDLHRSYVLFVRRVDSRTDEASVNVSGTSNDAGRQLVRGFRLSAFPVRKSRRNIATVVQYTSCTRCGRAPVVRLMPETGELRRQTGQRLLLRCQARRARPTPRFIWSRDGQVLVDRVNRVRITSSRRRGSKLQVRRLREGDAGTYQCQAVNVVGQSERRSVDVIVVPGVEPTKLHSVLCPEHSYCLNGGTCFILLSLGRRYCVCQQGFHGERCEERDIDISEARREFVTAGAVGLKSLEVILLVCGIVAAALTTVAIAIIIFASARRCVVERQETKAHRLLDDSRQLLANSVLCSDRVPVSDYVDASVSTVDVNQVVTLRNQVVRPHANGEASRSDPRRRARLTATSATLDSDELHDVGDLRQPSRDDADRALSASVNQRPAVSPDSPLHDWTTLEKETTC